MHIETEKKTEKSPTKIHYSIFSVECPRDSGYVWKSSLSWHEKKIIYTCCVRDCIGCEINGPFNSTKSANNLII